MKSIGWLTWWTLGIVLLVRSDVGHAVLLSVVPTAQTVVRGQTFGVGIEIAGLGAFQPPSLSVWNLDLSFDAKLLTLTTVIFGDPVLGDLVDFSGLATSFGLVVATPGVGSVNLSEVSLDAPGDLAAYQPDHFLLATLNFQAIALGRDSPLGLVVNQVGDSFGEQLIVQAVHEGTVTVTEFPELSTVLLVGTGIIGLLWLKRKVYRRALVVLRNW